MVLGSQFSLLLVAQTCEIAFPSRTKIDVPAPEATQQRLGFSIVVCSEFTITTVV